MQTKWTASSPKKGRKLLKIFIVKPKFLESVDHMLAFEKSKGCSREFILSVSDVDAVEKMC